MPDGCMCWFVSCQLLRPIRPLLASEILGLLEGGAIAPCLGLTGNIGWLKKLCHPLALLSIACSGGGANFPNISDPLPSMYEKKLCRTKSKAGVRSASGDTDFVPIGGCFGTL